MPLINPVPVFNFNVFLMNATTGSSSSLAAGIGAVAGAALGAMLTGTFSEVSGLNAEMETEEYREGGRNSGPHKFVKWGKYPNLVFKRGVTPNTDLWDWYYQVLYGDQKILRKNKQEKQPNRLRCQLANFRLGIADLIVEFVVKRPVARNRIIDEECL